MKITAGVVPIVIKYELHVIYRIVYSAFSGGLTSFRNGGCVGNEILKFSSSAISFYRIICFQFNLIKSCMASEKSNIEFLADIQYLIFKQVSVVRTRLA